MVKAKLKDHQIGELTNSLRDCAKKYHGAEQLRSRLSSVLSHYIESIDRPNDLTAVTDPDHEHNQDKLHINNEKIKIKLERIKRIAGDVSCLGCDNRDNEIQKIIKEL